MEKEKQLAGQATPGQIEAWKQKHGDVFAVTVGNSVCYLKRPTRKAISYASVAGKNDPLKFNEVLLNDCWLGGDDRIKSDDTMFISASAKVAELIEVKEAELKKL